jgi:CRISPR-associated endonuclease Csy4
MRLHGSDTALDELMALPWLKGMRDHLEQQQPELLNVPDTCQWHRVVRRVQVQSSAERLRRRLVKRHPGQVDAEEALRRIPDEAAERTSLPYVQLHSRSTGQHFFLFVQHGPLQTTPLPGEFSAYGLSQQGATVPWF